MVDLSHLFVEKSAQEYAKTLSTPPPNDQERLRKWKGGEGEVVVGEGDTGSKEILRALELEGMRRQEALIEKAICLTINDVFRPVGPDQYKDDEVIPSMSSSFRLPGRKGGACQELVDNDHYGEGYDLGKDCEGRIPVLWKLNDDLIRFMYSPRRGLLEVRGALVVLEGEFIPEGERARARTAAVLEACKVRWVSIGDAKPYFRAKAWNRLVYSQLPNHPTFELVGRPLALSDVNRMVDKYLLSGDYKGATDTLDPRWSEFTFRKITERLYKYATEENSIAGVEERIAGLLPMLTQHTMTHMGTEFDQETGQLMGSFLSFPILCIINAAINRLYLDPDLKTPLPYLPLLVNGDDVMMSSDTPFTDWADHISLVGLRPSLGKNYVHTHVCCLNSEFYIRGDPGTEFERSYPWRLNLVYGQDSDADGGEFGNHVNRPDHLQLSTLGAMARTLVEHQTERDSEALLSEFISNNGKILKNSRRCWWTPEELGGLGLPLTKRTIGKVNDLARLIATYLMTRVQPADALIYAARGAPQSTSACQEWMAADQRAKIHKGFTYEWLTQDEAEDPSPPEVPLRDYLGYGTVPKTGSTHDAYKGLLKKVLAAKGFLTPCSDETLLEFARLPRKAGWVRRDNTPTTTDAEKRPVDRRRPYCSYAPEDISHQDQISASWTEHEMESEVTEELLFPYGPW